VGIRTKGQQHVLSLEISSRSSVAQLFSPKFGPRVALGLHTHAAPKI
jgi:hypothetical protein